MNLALSFLEKRRDLGLLVLRVVVGGTYVFLGWEKLMAGPRRWEELGRAMNHFGLSGGHLYWGIAATLVELVGGVFFLLGLLVRPWAIALCGCALVATVVQWQSLNWDKMGSVTGFFYPLSMAAVAFALIFIGGGKYGFETGGGRGSSAPKEE